MEYSKHSKGQTSVKVHYQPGGYSNFSLAHDDGAGTDDRWGNSNKIGSRPDGRAPPQQQQQFQPYNAAPWERREEPKQAAAPAGPGAFTSVKYSGNPPGGKSSISLF